VTEVTSRITKSVTLLTLIEEAGFDVLIVNCLCDVLSCVKFLTKGAIGLVANLQFIIYNLQRFLEIFIRFS